MTDPAVQCILLEVKVCVLVGVIISVNVPCRHLRLGLILCPDPKQNSLPVESGNGGEAMRIS